MLDVPWVCCFHWTYGFDYLEIWVKKV